MDMITLLYNIMEQLEKKMRKKQLVEANSYSVLIYW